ncbi:hypothetical protein CDD83_2882 [Cordyceps sp. RAO-2017]|nr:hypothetical protein CDD83_2882 [Cordyceps sp. RAO-2017]
MPLWLNQGLRRRTSSVLYATGLATSVNSRGFLNFHSYDRPPNESPWGSVRGAILSAAYEYVPTYGFVGRALTLGARDAGLLDISSSVLDDGVFPLIQYHLVTQRLRLVHQPRPLPADVEEKGRPAIDVMAEVLELSWARLMANTHIVHQWKEALAVMAQPGYISASLEELYLLSDEIWFLAGDKAVDSSWLSRRASLAVVYSSAELFMTNDKSPDFTETREFLGRRLGDANFMDNRVFPLGLWTRRGMKAGMNVLRSATGSRRKGPSMLKQSSAH